MMSRKLAALSVVVLGSCTSVAQAESQLRIAMTATDIPTTTGMPNNGFEGLRFLGYRRDIPDFLSALDLYVLPSLWEGLPLSLLEALAAGKPVVATRVGGNAEIIEQGVNGRLVPARDEAALAEAIMGVRGDAALRAAATHGRGVTGRTNAMRHFMWQAALTARFGVDTARAIAAALFGEDEPAGGDPTQQVAIPVTPPAPAPVPTAAPLPAPAAPPRPNRSLTALALERIMAGRAAGGGALTPADAF